jgi:hypothetical protein
MAPLLVQFKVGLKRSEPFKLSLNFKDNTPLRLDVRGNDTDVNHEPINISSVTSVSASVGTLSIVGDQIEF